MLLLEAGNIEKYYGDRLILAFSELKIYTGDRIGIVGLNGSGKTTLLNLLSKDTEPDKGYVKQHCSIAYIRQFSGEKINAESWILGEFGLLDKTDRVAFSGGEKTRIRIANAVSRQSMLLLADEPTSNLDFNGIELLKQKLWKMETFLVISHDRDLLDVMCNKVIEIGSGRIKTYNGNYSFYREQKDREHEREIFEYGQYVTERNNLENAIQDRKRKAGSIRKAPRRMGKSEARLHRRSANEKQEKVHNAVKSLKTRLEKLEVRERPKKQPPIKLDFSLTNPPCNKIVISAENFSFNYGSRTLFYDTGFRLYNGSKIALYGGNGTGKTTLLNLIHTGQCGIYTVPKARTGYFRQEFENLKYDRTVLENVMEDSIQPEGAARIILARLLIAGDDVYKKAGVLSGGERIKVSFAKLFVSDANILLLDEPTNYLDIPSIEALEKVLAGYEGTVLFVSHDRSFIKNVADRLISIEAMKFVDQPISSPG